MTADAKQSSVAEDSRVSAARAAAGMTRDAAIALILKDLLSAHDERLRVNVGLVHENALLRKQAREHRCSDPVAKGEEASP